jgi:NAD(P)-dependent dehydrogenase (short-subunit alcohol dehydrogenase family)
MTTEPIVEQTVHKLFDLTGKRALISGASGYLGQAMSRALAEAGASVIVTSRELSRAQQALQNLPVSPGARHTAAVLDQMQAERLDDDFSRIIAAAGPIDILVNNGHDAEPADWTDITPEKFTRQLSNATGYFILSRLFRDHVVQREAAGSLILLGSMYGLVGSYPDAYEGVCAASSVAYHALKGGIVHMTRHLAVYWAKDRIRVNCLCPGPFPPPRITSALVERLCQKSPMGRMGQACELKGAIVFLASEASSYMTGQNLVIDGGWTAW